MKSEINGAGRDERNGGSVNRRTFVRHALTATIAAPILAPVLGLAAESAEPPKRKIKLGLVGCGGRGTWIGKLFAQHGGYLIHSVADYFPDIADRAGEALGVDKARRFSGLSGYKRVLESGIEAIALETLPCFFPEMVRNAIAAGVHVYMAKPVAVDVPGALEIGALGKQATAKNLCLLVDYQLPTDPHNMEVAKLVRAGEIGPIAVYLSHYLAAQWPDPPLTPTIESRLTRLIWCNDIALGGGHHVNACIHAIDGGLWLAGQRPVSAVGLSRIARAQPHGDSHDIISVSFEFADGVVWNHGGKHLNNQQPFEVAVIAQGTTGFAQVTYGGKATLRSRENAYSGDVANVYEAGAIRNIAAFYQQVTEGKFENLTVPRAVDGVLTTILCREATMRRVRLTMAELLKENKRIEVNVKGLKA